MAGLGEGGRAQESEHSAPKKLERPSAETASEETGPQSYKLQEPGSTSL